MPSARSAKSAGDCPDTRWTVTLSTELPAWTPARTGTRTRPSYSGDSPVMPITACQRRRYRQYRQASRAGWVTNRANQCGQASRTATRTRTMSAAVAARPGQPRLR